MSILEQRYFAVGYEKFTHSFDEEIVKLSMCPVCGSHFQYIGLKREKDKRIVAIAHCPNLNCENEFKF